MMSALLWLLASLLSPCTAQEAEPGPHAQAAEEGWDIQVSAEVNVPPEGDVYWSPTITADRGALHLEARYNYEALGSYSASARWNSAPAARGNIAAWLAAFDQELEVDRGFLLGLSIEGFWLDLFLFNPDLDEPYGGATLGFEF